MAEAGTYDWTSAESWGTFITDNTWSLPNSLVASVFATIGVATGRTIDKGLSKGTNQLVFQERLVDPYATTLGNVTFGRDVPIHERLHATQARAFGPYYYPLFGLSYLAVGFYMLFAGDHSAFSEKWMKCDVYPNTPFEAWAYHVQGHPGC